MIRLLAFLLEGTIHLIEPFLTELLGSTVGGLFEGLSNENGLVEKLLGAVGGALHGVAKGIISSLSDYLKTILT